MTTGGEKDQRPIINSCMVRPSHRIEKRLGVIFQACTIATLRGAFDEVSIIIIVISCWVGLPSVMMLVTFNAAS